MGLTWMLVVIAGCVALAACIAAVLFRPMGAERRRLRPLANAGRLTLLPEYARAVRARTVAAIVTIVLLAAMFVGSTIAAARPTGLPTTATQYGGGDPEDIMLCIGSPPTDPAVNATLNYFAGRVGAFGTQRIGLTSSNRRVIPLTRDYQYAKQTLSDYARPIDQRGDVAAFSAPVVYEDYSRNVDDLLTLCLTGFPGFDQATAQRRSLIYVGSDAARNPDASLGPTLFTADRVKELAATGGVQLNAVVTGQDSGALASLAADTGGRALPGGPSVAASLDDIRDHPPAARFSEDADGGAAPESPDVPVLIALAAAMALAGWPIVRRR